MLYEELVSFVGENLDKNVAKSVEKHIAVEFNIYGEGEGAFYVEVKDGDIVVEPYEYYDRDAKVYVSGEELMKIVSGEKTPEESFAVGSLMVEGDVDAAQELIKLIKKTPSKKTTVKKSAPKKVATKKETAEKTVKAEKTIVEETKKKTSKVAKDIKK